MHDQGARGRHGAPCQSAAQLARGPAFGQIEEGATVRERQKILSIIDLNGKTLVIARVEESQIKKITLGMKATIRIDAFPGQSFDGTVIEVSPLPVPSSSNDGDKRFFATKVKIDNGVPGLRPGLTAEVEFLVAKLNKVLTVPANAVISYEGKHRVAIKRPDGFMELRGVTLGLSDGDDVEITHGIKPATSSSLIATPSKAKGKRTKNPSIQPGRGTHLDRVWHRRCPAPCSFTSVESSNPAI